MTIQVDQVANAKGLSIAPNTTTSGNAFVTNPSTVSVIVCGIWINGSSADGTKISMTDNGAIPNRYTNAFSFRFTSSNNTLKIFRSTTSPLSMPSSGNLTPAIVYGTPATTTFSVGLASRSYLNMQTNTDGTAQANNSSAATISATIQPTVANDLMFTVFANNSAATSNTPSVASPFTTITTLNDGTFENGGIGELITSDSSAHTATWTWNQGDSSPIAVVIVAFQATLGSATPITTPPVNTILQATKRAGYF